MAYRIRVLSTTANCVPLALMRNDLERDDLSAKLTSDEEASADWTNLLLSHSAGPDIAAIERNVVTNGSRGEGELEDWWMGVLRDDQWVHFQMDLGNRKHREAFFRGEVPAGAKLAPKRNGDRLKQLTFDDLK